MNQNLIFSTLLMLAATVATGAQTSSQPASSTTKAATTTAKPATTAKPGTATRTGAAATHTATTATANKLPPGVPVVHALVKTAFSLRYQDITVGTGADAQPNKIYKVHYTGYLGNNGRPDDGRKFDSSYDRVGPVTGPDGKPVNGDDGKPKMAAQPIVFPQGMGRLIPGFDQGFEGMKIGGKRRLFIPWQLAYGAAGRPGPDAVHPGIPPKADLIFDVELVDITDMPSAPSRPPSPPVGARPFGSTPPQPGAGGAGQPVANPDASRPATPAAPSTPPPSPSTPATPRQPK